LCDLLVQKEKLMYEVMFYIEVVTLYMKVVRKFYMECYAA